MNSATENKSLLNTSSLSARSSRKDVRQIKDTITRMVMTFGGISVIIAIILIAIYLVWVVVPLFLPAHISKTAEFAVPDAASGESLYYALEEQREIATRVMDDGKITFINAYDGNVIATEPLVAENNAEVTSFAAGSPTSRLLAFGMSDGSVAIRYHQYNVSYPDDVRVITPQVFGPFEGRPVVIDDSGSPIIKLAVQGDEDQTTIAALTADLRLLLINLTVESNFLTGEETVNKSTTLIPVEGSISHLLMDVDQSELYFTDNNDVLHYYDIRNKQSPVLVQSLSVVDDGIDITAMTFLSGGISVIIGDSTGTIAQWFPVRDENNEYALHKICVFDSQTASIVQIVPEYYRKGFLALDSSGMLGIYHATAHRTVKLQQLDISDNGIVAIAPRANGLVVENAESGIEIWDLENEHPEVSWSSLWGKVWYENRDGPEYIWQSSSASSIFEPKFSLTPLAFGTLKASLYAMVFAIPLSIMGAIYTAYFMSAGLRNVVKPTIEIMAALPTVILGFLAGLWFAPMVEAYLPAMFLLFLVVPAAILIAAYLWQRLPETMRHAVPHGWESVLLVPVIILATAIVFWVSKPIELWMFGGNLPLWLNQELGISFDQRNSFVVGIAIGFAVIPTIFSISEDAIFGVPKHLTTGSLALGATAWQTMAKVILLTASPGIFSAVMIGLGRAVGETMIVVMATGNTAIMDLNIFQGFRALSANIAVEMPESELGSTHYRILFLAGLVLFMATFFFNTLAEVVRQRLRVKYSTL